MKIEYKEMQLQLLLSPAILICTDKVANRPTRDNHLNQGHMMLSGLQVFFSLVRHHFIGIFEYVQDVEAIKNFIVARSWHVQ